MKMEEENIDPEPDLSVIEVFVQEGVYPSEAPVLALLEKLIDPNDYVNYEIDNEGHVVQLLIYESYEVSMDLLPIPICELKFLQELTFQSQNIRKIPECIRNLTNLERLSLDYNNIRDFPKAIEELKNLTYLDLSYNKIQEIPAFVNELTQLNYLYLADEELNVPHRNVFDCLDIADLKENLSLKGLSELFAELEKKEQLEREKLTRIFNERQEPWNIIYPPKETLHSFTNKSKKFEFVVLWMLTNNFSCEWLDFKEEPLNMSPATLSKYLKFLAERLYILKVSKTSYMIMELGKRRLREIEHIRNE